MARDLSKIFCERASFELKEEDVVAYRNHIKLQAANVAAKTQEEEEYRVWKVASCFLQQYLGPCIRPLAIPSAWLSFWHHPPSLTCMLGGTQGIRSCMWEHVRFMSYKGTGKQ